MNSTAWVRILVGAVWLNGAVEKLLSPSFPRQFAASLNTGATSPSPSMASRLHARHRGAQRRTCGATHTLQLGTGLGPPEFLGINLLVALISLVILLSPAAETLSRYRSGPPQPSPRPPPHQPPCA